MAFAQCFTPISLFPLKPISEIRSLFPTLLLNKAPNYVRAISCSSSKAIPVTEQQVLEAIAESNENNLPCVRTYENDVSQLTLVGAVDFEQALTAAAADGGEAASEHISSGIEAMVVETVFPGSSDEHSTVSTRLFLPARKVKEKATKLRRSISEDLLSSTTSRNILAMTFRQVVLRQLWNFELVVFRPGTERSMEFLENPREVPASFTLSSSDDSLISRLAEAVCISALHSTERQFVGHLQGANPFNFSTWFQKVNRVVSKDSSVILYKFEDEIIENANTLLERYTSAKAITLSIIAKPKRYWWMPSYHSKLEKIGGSGFSAWASEYIPAYRLEIESEILEEAKFEGLKKSADNRWEVLLTHSQMVALADTLDMYYEDSYSVPNKQLSSGVAAKVTNLSNKKWGYSLLKMVSLTLASGIFLVAISALGHFSLPHMLKVANKPVENHPLLSPEADDARYQIVDTVKLEEFCISAVKKVKDALGWPGDIKIKDGIGAWTGEIPTCLKVVGETDSNTEGISTNYAQLDNIVDVKTSAEDIASYQVVFSSDGKIIGLQPLSRVAVNHWAANPIAEELYGGRKLSPSLIEPGLKVPHPREVAVVELLMSVKPDACFALARSFR